MTGPMIRAASLRGFGPVISELGGDPIGLLSRFGIDPQAVEAENGLISLTAHDLMLDAAAQELACPDLGLRLAEAQDLSILGPLAVAIESSSTAAEALECASRFMFVHSPALSIDLVSDPSGRRGVVALSYRKDLRESPYSPQAMELGLGVFYGVAGALLGTDTALRTVLLPHAPLSPVTRYTEFFGVDDVRFAAPLAALCVQRSLLDSAFESTDELIRAMAVEHLASHYPDTRTLTSTRVRHLLSEGLGAATPTLAHTARLLTLHPRTLQRRLAEEGMTFEGVLDDVRRAAAHRYLTTTTLPLSQVAAAVGFGEQSTLSHAVRRWFGASPREVRAGSPVTLSR